MARSVPDRFEAVFVREGRLACEKWFSARRDTIDKWLDERGKARLIAERASFVAKQRANDLLITRSTRMVERREVRQPSIRESIRDRRKVSDQTARHAAQFLRVIRNGGFIVSPASDGNWWVGSRRLSAAQMLDLAKAKGFEPLLHSPSDGEVKS